MEGSPNNQFYSREAFDKAETEEEKQELISKAHDEATREDKDFQYSVVQKEQIGGGLSQEEMGVVSSQEINGTLSLEEIEKLLKISNIQATLDTSFEGGVIDLEITEDMIKNLESLNSALKLYEKADNGTPSYVFRQIDLAMYVPIKNTNLEFVVLNCQQTTKQERDALVGDMDKIGYRTAELSELFAFGVLKPELNKRSEFLDSLREYVIGGEPNIACLNYYDKKRRLDLVSSSGNFIDPSGGWTNVARFLFVRK